MSIQTNKYTQSPVIYNNRRTIGLYVPPDDLSTTTYDVYKVEAGYAGNPTEIAVKFYGDYRYYWLIIEYNKPINPFGWPKVDDTIKIPRK